jgi:hypothetical protein
MIEEGRAQLRIPELLADEPTRQELTKARMRTRASLARRLRVTIETIRRSVRRSDLYLSTLRGYAERGGGSLRLEVTFPDRPPVILAGLGEPQRQKPAKKRAGIPAKSKTKTRRAA